MSPHRAAQAPYAPGPAAQRGQPHDGGLRPDGEEQLPNGVHALEAEPAASSADASRQGAALPPMFGNCQLMLVHHSDSVQLSSHLSWSVTWSADVSKAIIAHERWQMPAC